MNGPMKRALISLTDKSGIEEFAQRLSIEFGVEIISTGGTAKQIRNAGVPVTDVSEITSFPEMMGGRLKTIHPRIAGGLLARRDNQEDMKAAEEHGIPMIDMVVVNLYDFGKVASKPGVGLDELIENIDIGGPTMIRAAAKNWRDVVVVTSSADYHLILREMSLNMGHVGPSSRWMLAKLAFEYTAKYDQAIAHRLKHVGIGEQGEVTDNYPNFHEAVR